jgi:hypothetical protein
VGREPIGARAPDGEWEGELRPWHQSAASLLGCSTVERAVTYAPLDLPDAVDLPKALFLDHLEAFAREWSARFLPAPRASDRIRGTKAQFVRMRSRSPQIGVP